MKMRKEKEIVLLEWLLGIVGFLFLVGISVTFTLNFRPLYYLDMKLLNIPEQSGYEADLVKENYDRLITYNNITYDGELTFKNMSMSETARIHFEEVKMVFGVFEWMGIIAGIVFILGAIVLWKAGKYGWMKATAVCSIGIPVVAGIFIAADWENAFIMFHELVFRNSYWLFDPSTDPIITVLPDMYFFHCAVLILALIIMASIIFEIAYRKNIQKLLTKKKKTKKD